MARAHLASMNTLLLGSNFIFNFFLSLKKAANTRNFAEIGCYEITAAVNVYVPPESYCCSQGQDLFVTLKT